MSAAEDHESMSQPAYRYVVVRAAVDLPEGFLPASLEGKWFDLDSVPMTPIEGVGRDGEIVYAVGSAVAVPTDRFERNDEGATARVYEVRP